MRHFRNMQFFQTILVRPISLIGHRLHECNISTNLHYYRYATLIHTLCSVTPTNSCSSKEKQEHCKYTKIHITKKRIRFKIVTIDVSRRKTTRYNYNDLHDARGGAIREKKDDFDEEYKRLSSN